MDFNLNLDGIESGKFSQLDKEQTYDTFIIGTGPAAISAAIYASRKGLKTALAGPRIGGQVLDTLDIENKIGIEKVTGMEYANLLEKHAKNYEISFLENHFVKKVEQKGKDKTVTLDNGDIYNTKTVIVATGAKRRLLNVPGEEEYKGKGVHYCSTCDGPFYNGMDIAVIGGGNSGVESAIYLADLVNNAAPKKREVTLVEFMPELKADKVLVDKLKEKSNVKVIVNAAVENIYGEQFVTGLKYKDRATNEVKDLKIEGMFIEIGMTANSEFIKDILEVNQIGEIIIDDKNETSTKGIFAAGDVTTERQKQIIIAEGSGARAALNVYEYLLKEY